MHGPTGDRRSLIPLLGTSTLYGLIAMMMTTVLAVHLDRLGATAFYVGALYAASALAFLLFPPVWGAVSDVLRAPKRIMVVSLVLAAVLMPLFIVFDEPAGVVALRFVFVAFACGFVPAALAQTSLIGGARGRGAALGLLNASMGLGRGTGQVLAGILLAWVSRSSTFLAMTALASVAIVLLLPFRPASVPPPGDERGSVLSEVRRRLFPRVSETAHLRRFGLIWLYVSFSIRDIMILGTFAMMPIYLLKDAGLSELHMGLLLAINPMSQVFFQVIFGRLSDSVGRKKLLAAGLLGSAMVPVLWSFATHPWVIGVGMVWVALSYSSLASGTTAFIGDAAPPGREAELMGLHLTFRGIGGVVGPLVVGALSHPDALGFRVTFGAMSTLGFVAFLLVCFLTEETLGRSSEAAGGAPDTP